LALLAPFTQELNSLSLAKAWRMAAISKMGAKQPASSLSIGSERSIVSRKRVQRGSRSARWQASLPDADQLERDVQTPARDWSPYTIKAAFNAGAPLDGLIWMARGAQVVSRSCSKFNGSDVCLQAGVQISFMQGTEPSFQFGDSPDEIPRRVSMRQFRGQSAHELL
jgi:hypothetical protein